MSRQVVLGGVGGLIAGFLLSYGFGALTAPRSFEAGAEMSGNRTYEFALVDDDAETDADVRWTIYLDSDKNGTANGSCGKGVKSTITLGDGNWRVVKVTRSVPGPTPTEARTDHDYTPLTPTKNLMKFDGLFVRSYYLCVVKETALGETRFVAPVGLRTK